VWEKKREKKRNISHSLRERCWPNTNLRCRTHYFTQFSTVLFQPKSRQLKLLKERTCLCGPVEIEFLDRQNRDRLTIAWTLVHVHNDLLPKRRVLRCCYGNWQVRENVIGCVQNSDSGRPQPVPLLHVDCSRSHDHAAVPAHQLGRDQRQVLPSSSFRLSVVSCFSLISFCFVEFNVYS